MTSAQEHEIALPPGAARRFVSRLFGTRASVPEGEVIYAVGDIHGRDDLLGRLHEAIAQDLAAAAQARRATVVYLGDYVDRGPDSKAVLDRLLDDPVKDAGGIFLKGNHEDAMLRFLGGETRGDAWLALGGGATARSYGVCLRGDGPQAVPPELTPGELRAAIPRRHLQFLQALRLYHEAGDYLFVHAGVRPGRPLEDQEPQDLLWIRGDFLRSRRRHGRIVVHGHAAGSEIVVRGNRICIDTMAYATDRLSCLVLEGNTRRFISAAL
ncbi:MAG TPA: metallophosphoesterase family protein [Kiloniellaceae bacterium]